MMLLIIAALLVFNYYLNKNAWLLFVAGLMTAGGIEELVRRFDHTQPLMTKNEFIIALATAVLMPVMIILGNKFKEFNRRP